MSSFFIGLVNLIIKALGALLSLLLSALPNSPFQSVDFSAIQDNLGVLAWILPVAPVISIFTAWLSCIVVYYVYQIVLRTVNAIK